MEPTAELKRLYVQLRAIDGDAERAKEHGAHDHFFELHSAGVELRKRINEAKARAAAAESNAVDLFAVIPPKPCEAIGEEA